MFRNRLCFILAPYGLQKMVINIIRTQSLGQTVAMTWRGFLVFIDLYCSCRDYIQSFVSVCQRF